MAPVMDSRAAILASMLEPPPPPPGRAPTEPDGGDVLEASGCSGAGGEDARGGTAGGDPVAANGAATVGDAAAFSAVGGDAVTGIGTADGTADGAAGGAAGGAVDDVMIGGAVGGWAGDLMLGRLGGDRLPPAAAASACGVASCGHWGLAASAQCTGLARGTAGSAPLLLRTVVSDASLGRADDCKRDASRDSHDTGTHPRDTGGAVSSSLYAYLA